MRRFFLCSVVSLSLLGALSGPAFADLTATVTLHDSFGNSSGAGHGGEFLASYSGFDFEPVSLGESAGQVEVFCVERNEYIQFGATYYVDFNNAAVNGGAGGPSPDPLNNETAFLYNRFITRNLAGYDYANAGPGRTESANALQNVIWYLEEELEGHSYTWGLNSVEAGLADQFYQVAMSSTWTDTGTVQIMNMFRYADGTGNRQDQLVMSPVPAPGAVFLAMFGLGLVGWMNRKTPVEA